MRLRVSFALMTGLLVLLAVACGVEEPVSVVPDLGADTVEAAPVDRRLEEFNPDNFARPTEVDNMWFPLRPGHQYVYEGTTIEDGEAIPHRIIFTVTDLVKVINGVPSVVVWDRDYSDGELIEAELAFFAQDNDGNVWHMGQYPEEYEEGSLVVAPAWLAGIRSARAGIQMMAKLQMEAPSFSQGWAPEVNWTDRSQVYQMATETCVAAGCFEDVLVMDEFSASEMGAFQLKHYAPDVGLVRVGWRGDDEQQEELELMEIIELDAAAMAEARAEALLLERSAYQVSRGVYIHTLPAEPGPNSAAYEPPEARLEQFDRNNFANATRVDNVWFPLTPGTQLVFEGNTLEDGVLTPHRVIFTVTDLVKEINGVPAVVLWDQDFANGVLVEAELAFFAQDDDGNVWHMGQYPEEYDNGLLEATPAWIAGQQGAQAGIHMKAVAALATPSYSQGWGPAVGWPDRARVFQMGQELCTPVACYDDVLVMEEFAFEEPGAFQLKYYAAGVGNVHVSWRGLDNQQEELTLVELNRLDAAALAAAREEARLLEARAHQIRQDIFATTPRAEEMASP